MIFSQDKLELRKMYVDAWRKFCAGEVLSPLETQIAQVVSDHPEYQPMMVARGLDDSFTPEEGKTNPFLHMGLHLALRDQIATDRPPGIARTLRALRKKHTNPHDAEHKALDCLAEALWVAQRNNAAPDEQAYLQCLRRL